MAEDKDLKVQWRYPAAMDRALAARAEGRKPDFTVTGACLERVQQGSSELPTVVTVAWETASAGFGELSIVQHTDGRIALDTEGMSADFCKRVLARLIDEAGVLP